MQNRLKKILMVDDDRVCNLMHQRAIQRTGLVETIDVVTDGVAALQYLDDAEERGEDAPDLILLDVNMPRMGGFEFLNELANRPGAIAGRQVVIMLSTALLMADRQRAAADPSVLAFANKPIRSDGFSKLVAGLIAQQNGEQGRVVVPLRAAAGSGLSGLMF